MEVATKVLSLVSVFGLVAVPPSPEVSTNCQRHTMPGRVAAQSVTAPEGKRLGQFCLPRVSSAWLWSASPCSLHRLHARHETTTSASGTRDEYVGCRWRNDREFGPTHGGFGYTARVIRHAVGALGRLNIDPRFAAPKADMVRLEAFRLGLYPTVSVEGLPPPQARPSEKAGSS